MASSCPATRGISLFIVPKHLVDERGALTGERNDVALAGLNHKLGYRGIPNTLLNFGEGRYPVPRRNARQMAWTAPVRAPWATGSVRWAMACAACST